MQPAAPIWKRPLWPKTTAHRCQRPFRTKHNCSQTETTTIAGATSPAAMWQSNQMMNDDLGHCMSFGLVSPSYTRPNIPHQHPLATWPSNDGTSAQKMTQCRTTTMKKGHTMTTCRQHAMMKTCHDNTTTERTWNEDTTTRPCEDKATMKRCNMQQQRHCASRTAMRTSTSPSPSISPHHPFPPPCPH